MSHAPKLSWFIFPMLSRIVSSALLWVWVKQIKAVTETNKRQLLRGWLIFSPNESQNNRILECSPGCVGRYFREINMLVSQIYWQVRPSLKGGKSRKVQQGVLCEAPLVSFSGPPPGAVGHVYHPLPEAVGVVLRFDSSTPISSWWGP